MTSFMHHICFRDIPDLYHSYSSLHHDINVIHNSPCHQETYAPHLYKSAQLHA